MNLMLNHSGAQATVYTKLGQTLRVPLSAPGLSPERQLVTWFNRQAAANPGFPARVKSLLLVVGQPPCRACRQTLDQFLRRWNLDGKLRLVSSRAAAAPPSCGCTLARPRPYDDYPEPAWPIYSEPPIYLDEMMNEAEVPANRRRGAAPRTAGTRAGRSAAPASRPQRSRQMAPPQPPLQTGAYGTIGGHHVHQSAAYTPPVPAGQAQPTSRKANKNHRPAVAIRQNVPGFTKDQHDSASAIQTGMNQAAHGADVNVQQGTIGVQSSGDGRLPPTPTPWFEDMKAYQALLAAGRTPSEAYAAVQTSNQQLDASGTVPLRVPRH